MGTRERAIARRDSARAMTPRKPPPTLSWRFGGALESTNIDPTKWTKKDGPRCRTPNAQKWRASATITYTQSNCTCMSRDFDQNGPLTAMKEGGTWTRLLVGSDPEAIRRDMKHVYMFTDSRTQTLSMRSLQTLHRVHNARPTEQLAQRRGWPLPDLHNAGHTDSPPERPNIER